ncbi:MAG: hypothetical protein PHD11_03875 [Bacteroidales bacterium]|nr:hypothetical protein [Bacteroidales bacterium]MDD4670352.1 hypothetical protein [Bacteroidales bacterium]
MRRFLMILLMFGSLGALMAGCGKEPSAGSGDRLGSEDRRQDAQTSQNSNVREIPEGMLPSKLSKDTILIGDQVTWSMNLDLKEGQECYFEQPEDPVAQGVETIERLTMDTLSLKKGKLDIEGRMVLTAFDSGSYFLPPVLAMVSNSDGSVDTMFFDGPVLEVTTVPIDTATFKPFDIKGQIKYPVTFRELMPWIGLVLLLAAIVYAICRFVKYRKENRTFFGKPIVKDPPHIVALRSLEKIRGQKLWQNNRQKQFYTAVTDTLRQYISDRYHVSAMEQTSNEIFDSLKDKGIEARLFDSLKQLFTTADYVKFAKHNASTEENEEAIPTAVRFVNATFMQELENNKKEE